MAEQRKITMFSRTKAIRVVADASSTAFGDWANCAVLTLRAHRALGGLWCDAMPFLDHAVEPLWLLHTLEATEL